MPVQFEEVHPMNSIVYVPSEPQGLPKLLMKLGIAKDQSHAQLMILVMTLAVFVVNGFLFYLAIPKHDSLSSDEMVQVQSFLSARESKYISEHQGQ